MAGPIVLATPGVVLEVTTVAGAAYLQTRVKKAFIPMAKVTTRTQVLMASLVLLVLLVVYSWETDSVLRAAASWCPPMFIKTLLIAGADPNTAGANGTTALMAACTAHMVGVSGNVRVLLEAGAEVNAEDGNGWTPLMIAANYCLVDIVDTVRMLIDAGGDVDARNYVAATPLIIAASHGCPRVVRVLLDSGADVNAVSDHGNTALYMAAGEDSKLGTETVKLLIEAGADVNVKRPDWQDTALMTAVQFGAPETVRLLLEAGADSQATDSKGRLSLTFARERGRGIALSEDQQASAEIVELLQAGRDFNSELIEAAKNGQTETVQALLKVGAEVDARINDGTTALLWAAAQGHVEVVRVLLSQGADLNVQLGGATPLQWAAFEGRTDVVQILLDAGADVNVRDYNVGKTALIWAEEKGHTEIVELLKKAGAKE